MGGMNMAREFDLGYVNEPYLRLCQEYPGTDVYPKAKFRTEWGPVFHRGRLDGAARVLVIGQDPAQNENVIRRILVGVAGQRIQGFLAKLGIERSYVMINTFLYSMYGNDGAGMKNDPQIATYRNLWINAILEKNKIEAVITLGNLADAAWKNWVKSTDGHTMKGVYQKIIHPTYPESFSNGSKSKLLEATGKLIQNWNEALEILHKEIKNPDIKKSLVLYEGNIKEDEVCDIPDFDIPAGMPDWMRTKDHWASREGANIKEKRGTIKIKVPEGE